MTHHTQWTSQSLSCNMPQYSYPNVQPESTPGNMRLLEEFSSKSSNFKPWRCPKCLQQHHKPIVPLFPEFIQEDGMSHRMRIWIQWKIITVEITYCQIIHVSNIIRYELSKTGREVPHHQTVMQIVTSIIVTRYYFQLTSSIHMPVGNLNTFTSWQRWFVDATQIYTMYS